MALYFRDLFIPASYIDVDFCIGEVFFNVLELPITMYVLLCSCAYGTLVLIVSLLWR